MDDGPSRGLCYLLAFILHLVFSYISLSCVSDCSSFIFDGVSH